MTDFKVGDRVRIITDDWSGIYKKGTLGTLREGDEYFPFRLSVPDDEEGLAIHLNEIEPFEYDQDTVNAIVTWLREEQWSGIASGIEKRFAVPQTSTVTVNFQVPEGESVVDYLGSIGIDYDIEGGN